MYLDTAANVTVGVGNLLANVAAAQALAFVVRPTGSSPGEATPATASQIAIDFNTVAAQPKGKNFRDYEPFTALILPESVIQALLLNRVRDFSAQLSAAFPDYGEFPAEVCAALFDMTFNLGLGGLLTRFPRFTQAVRNRDWATAARQCARAGIPSSRNAWTVAQFQCAAARFPGGPFPTAPNWPRESLTPTRQPPQTPHSASR